MWRFFSEISFQHVIILQMSTLLPAPRFRFSTFS
jgi:hypothetical protein